MIEGGGLGVFHPDEVGPMPVQVPNGVVDVPVADEAERCASAKRTSRTSRARYPDWECADQRVPSRHRAREPPPRVRRARGRARPRRHGSVLELRRHFGLGMVTGARAHRGPARSASWRTTRATSPGAIDRDGPDKAARFMQLCDAFDLPLLFLCDTPGMMVGPRPRRPRSSGT
jgi:acetyl-CoA carboxylase carboxyltransferase component